MLYFIYGPRCGRLWFNLKVSQPILCFFVSMELEGIRGGSSADGFSVKALSLIKLFFKPQKITQAIMINASSLV